MIISLTKWHILNDAVRKISKEIGVDVMEISDIEIEEEEEATAEFGINWSCMGQQDVATASEYIKKMGEALNLARFLNAQEIAVDWNEYFNISDNAEYWKKQREKLEEGLRKQRYTAIAKFAEA